MGYSGKEPVLFALDPERLSQRSIPVATGWLLGACMEARGKQELWLRQKPETLAVMRTQTLVQSVESSNRIEGVTVPEQRLRPLVLGRSKPRDRSEEELAGYRRALDWIDALRKPSMTPAVLRRLHALAQGGASGDAGEWKSRDNRVVEIRPNGERVVRFTPTTARETPQAVETLCSNYREIRDRGMIPELLSVSSFVFDFLCIHPFRDGNGRVSRLATTLLLLAEGIEVVRYVSLERLVEETKEDYYRLLAECSNGWHEGRNPIAPWWNYFLARLKDAYRELEKHLESPASGRGKSDLVRQTALSRATSFSLRDLAAQLPGISTQLIKKVLAELKAEGQLRLSGRGRGAVWELP